MVGITNGYNQKQISNQHVTFETSKVAFRILSRMADVLDGHSEPWWNS